jgi:succinate dehydrogenase / fumarate reductase flavoprotein subunit
VVSEKYGNLFDMYENIVGENPTSMPMKIYPAVHYTMGGFGWITTCRPPCPACTCLGEANFSDHGANRLGASALMQGLGRWLLRHPHTPSVTNLADEIRTGPIPTNTPEFDAAEKDVRERIDQFFINNKGTEPVDHFHRAWAR